MAISKKRLANILNPRQRARFNALSPFQKWLFRGMVNMAKSVHDDVLDGAFDVLDQANIQNACSAEPTTRTEAITTYSLANATMVADTDYTKANGDTSGRKVTVAAKSGETVDSSGTATHISLCDATRLLYVTTCTSQSLTSGNTVNFPAWDVEIADPT